MNSNDIPDSPSALPNPADIQVQPQSDIAQNDIDDSDIVHLEHVVEVSAAPVPVAPAVIAQAPVAEAKVEADVEEAPAHTGGLEDETVYLDNFEVGTSPMQPLKDVWKDEDVTLNVRSGNNADVDAAWFKQPNESIEVTEQGRRWKNSLEASYWTTPRADWFTTTISRSGAMFRQTVGFEGRELGISAPNIGSNTSGQRLTGEAAVIHMRAMMNMGNLRRVPLWHSGFWITIKAPGEARILELERRIADEKVELGRATHGLAYANQSVFLAGLLVEFVIEHIHSSSLKEDNPDYMDKILVLDIPLMVQGIAATIWPNGFQYARAVLNSTNVVQGRIDVNKLLFTDNRVLTAWQKGHMAGKHGKNMTQADLERYKSDFTVGKNSSIQINDNVAINLRIPTIKQYLTCGEKWVNSIVAMTDAAFGMDHNETSRNSYINAQGKASNMRQYAHWVESITSGQYLYTEEDIETQELLLSTMSSEDSARRTYFRDMQKFVEATTVSIVALPVGPDDEANPNKRFAKLVPIDTLACFFILLVQEANKIKLRA
jgi:hypothetical protein